MNRDFKSILVIVIVGFLVGGLANAYQTNTYQTGAPNQFTQVYNNLGMRTQYNNGPAAYSNYGNGSGNGTNYSDGSYSSPMGIQPLQVPAPMDFGINGGNNGPNGVNNNGVYNYTGPNSMNNGQNGGIYSGGIYSGGLFSSNGPNGMNGMNGNYNGSYNDCTSNNNSNMNMTSGQNDSCVSDLGSYGGASSQMGLQSAQYGVGSCCSVNVNNGNFATCVKDLYPLSNPSRAVGNLQVAMNTCSSPNDSQVTSQIDQCFQNAVNNLSPTNSASACANACRSNSPACSQCASGNCSGIQQQGGVYNAANGSLTNFYTSRGIGSGNGNGGSANPGTLYMQ